MLRSVPFSRLHALMALARQTNDPSVLLRYRSRGKGRGGNSPSHNLAAGRSKYMPHQGERECARRRQAAIW